jgi:hypothetical protein
VHERTTPTERPPLVGEVSATTNKNKNNKKLELQCFFQRYVSVDVIPLPVVLLETTFRTLDSISVIRHASTQLAQSMQLVHFSDKELRTQRLLARGKSPEECKTRKVDRLQV